MSRIKKLINSFNHYIHTCPSSIIKLIKNRSLWSKNETYFPEAKYHKSSLHIFIEQLFAVIRYGEINDFYFLYGFDTKTRKQCKEYIHHYEFRTKRDRKNFKPYNEICILRDKELFSIFGEAWNMPVVKTIGILENAFITTNKGKCLNLNEFICPNKETHLFFKPLNDECGKGIFSIDVENELILLNGIQSDLKSVEAYIDNLGNKKFIVQNKLIQHEDMDRLYDKAINTIRIITVKDKNDCPSVFGSLLRIGANGSIVDNLAKGGIAVGISPEGTLKSFGMMKPPYGKISNIHPDSKIKFEGYSIPYYSNAINLCIEFHKKFKGIFAIGWDVAITKDGPVFIEGNDNFEISGIQASNQGMKNKFYKVFC